MSDMNAVKDLVENYIKCWQKNRPEYKGMFEDNDFGCEHLQIFRNDFLVEDFSHGELYELAVLLTRSLRGQINRDHKIFWSWCSFITQYFHEQVQLFRDNVWVEAFGSLVDLLLSEERHIESVPGHMEVTTERLKYVNNHLISVCFNKHILAGAQAFAVLEGLLRRKVSDYVAADGVVRKYFTVVGSGGEIRTLYTGARMDRIDDGLRLFNQMVTRDRGRPCPAFRSLEGEILNLFPSAPNGYDLIEDWHNDLVHGREYWQAVTPIVLNVICFLVIDEIEPDMYDDALPDIKKHVERELTNRKLSGLMSPPHTFPPDLAL